ncbi:hypothetical protein [Rufibacter tibetensis]|uniref:Lipoprotein n=1 Tax=Rufibacter tibetensis TaxID=512763 RepID=A0A0P0C3B3_9BACT|nr:hypothetical protein [Rufibacter tibetensis]ALI99233.1 hypothetical protein DC20_09905 [Rufibacter tibetensis]
MKKGSKVLAAAALAVTFGFASCESKTAQNVENTAESAANEIEAEADSALAPTDTISVQDEPVEDGVADKVENQ